MLPAREGDCLWIRYGTAAKPRQILIDGGRAATAKDLKARFAALPPARRRFELLIVSHVDRDHIEGILSLVKDKSLGLQFDDVWFNGFDHLKDVELETFGAVQGEVLSQYLATRKPTWNAAWKRKAVCLGTKGLRSVDLPGGMTLTLLSPDRAKLTKLIPVWEKECKKAGLIPGAAAKPSEPPGLESFGAIDIEQLAASPFHEDPTQANGSSIAVIAEFGGKRALLAADAHTDRLSASIKTFKKTAKKLKLDAFKVAHHGSEHNVSRALLELVDCPRYLVSTNGSYFKHPTPSAMARLVKFAGQGATFCFNYRSKFTTVWDDATWKAKYGYQTVYPPAAQNGTLVVAL